MPLSLERLRGLRTQRGLTLQKVAHRMGISAPQVHRLENGDRRLTIDMFESYCAAVGVNPLEVYGGEIRVPIIGIVDADSSILPLPAGGAVTTRAPHIVPKPERLAAIRWAARSRFELMSGFLMFFYADLKGVPGDAWGKRCLVRRVDGSQRTGWLFRQDGQVHINDLSGDVEFNAKIEWASPILAVVAPQALSDTAP